MMYTLIHVIFTFIFKRIPDTLHYIEDDMSILLATNAHKHKHHSQD